VTAEVTAEATVPFYVFESWYRREGSQAANGPGYEAALAHQRQERLSGADGSPRRLRCFARVWSGAEDDRGRRSRGDCRRSGSLEVRGEA
jgi:hypothetical protein